MPSARLRARRVLPVSTWLDAVVAGLGVTSLTGAFLLGPLLPGGTGASSGLALLWPVPFLAVAGATLLRHRNPRTTSGARVVSSAVPLASTAGALLVLLRPGENWTSVSGLLAAGCITVALVRLALTIRESERLADSHRLARTDELTGLPNWRAFYDHAADLLDPSTSGPSQQAVLLLDLDRFKEVNDSLGHLMGDELLRLVGPRLAAQVARGDTIARLGGDEFGVVLTGHDEGHPAEVAERLCRSMEEPFDLDGISVQVGVSVGIALAPEHGTEATELMKRADVAMYAAKRARTGWRTYVAAEDPHSLERLRMVESLRSMLKGDGAGLELHYQPKIRLSDGAVVGVEALVRWRHPEHGLLYPDGFLDLVEESGLARQLTEHVLRQALTQCSRWRAQGLHVPVAVNLSATTVIDVDLPSTVAARLREHGLPASYLEVEITEAFLMRDWAHARAVLGALRELGVLVSVDDFGTGYSSLSYLRDLPIDQLKLDRSFVSRMEGDAMATALVRSTVSLAHSLGMQMVAEGVESADTLAVLASFDCDQAQGYHIGRPVPPDELELWILARQDLAARTLSRSVSGESAVNAWSVSQR